MAKETVPTLLQPVVTQASLLTDQDLHLFNEGTNYRIYDKLGAHLTTVAGQPGTYFAVWAPNARSVSVAGSFNSWDLKSHPLEARGSSGIWEGFIPGAGKGTLYKFHIVSHNQGYVVDKADPFGILHEEPPRTASVDSTFRSSNLSARSTTARTKTNSVVRRFVSRRLENAYSTSGISPMSGMRSTFLSLASRESPPRMIL